MTIGTVIAQCIRPGDLVGLVGELGAGKTQFVRGLARGLHIKPERVNSPTFVFMQEYPPDEDDEGTPVLAHVDAYRLAGPDELASIGWEGDAQDLRRGAVLVVEWADRITEAMGKDWLEVHFHHNGQGRNIKIMAHGAWRDRMKVLRSSLEPLACDKSQC